jgi:HEAT repeat protein
LIAFKSGNAVEALTQVAHYDESSRLRITALSGLGEFDHESVFEPVLLTCADPAREVRAAAARTFARLSVNRAQAYTRIAESEDPERLRLASMVCIDAGLAKHTLARLSHPDSERANEAFAMMRLLVAAEQFAPITESISSSEDDKASLIMIKALQIVKPSKMVPALYNLTTVNGVSAEVKRAISELVAELSTS